MSGSVVRTVSTYDAKTHFSQLLSEIEAGLEVVVTRHDRPVARIVPIRADRRYPGLLKGQILAPDGWDEFTDDDERAWYGQGTVPSSPTGGAA